MYKRLISIVSALVIGFSALGTINVNAETYNYWSTPKVERVEPVEYSGKRLLLETITSGDDLYDRVGYALSQGADSIKIKPKTWERVQASSFYTSTNKLEQLRKTYDATVTFNDENVYLSSKSLGKDTNITVTTYVAAYRNKDSLSLKRIAANKKANTLYNYCIAVIEKYVKPTNSDLDNISLLRNYVIARVTYDKTKERENTSNAYGALIEGTSICAGYSRAYCLLMRMAGYKCWVVAGTAPPQDGVATGHSWNAYRVDGKLYFTDCTWADGGDKPKKKREGLLYTYQDMEKQGYKFYLTEEEVEKLCKY